MSLAGDVKEFCSSYICGSVPPIIALGHLAGFLAITVFGFEAKILSYIINTTISKKNAPRKFLFVLRPMMRYVRT